MEAPTRAHAQGLETDIPAKQAWEQPTLVKLPRLTELTLATGGGIGGGGSGGSTVFG